MLDGRGRPVPAVHWERISREAGIVRGLAEWDARLARYAASVVDDDDDPSEWAEREGKTPLATVLSYGTVADDFPYLAKTPANAA